MAVQLDNRMKILINLYARHPISDIQSQPELLENVFGKSIEVLSQEWGFPQAQAFVQEMKARIESCRDELRIPDCKTQVAKCLNIVLDLVMFSKSETSVMEKRIAVLRALCLQTIAEPGNWTDNQKAHFGFVIDLLCSSYSCFISYTNQGAMSINHKFRKVIQLFVDKEVLDKRDPDRHNLLADAVLNRLNGNNLRLAFFDKSEIKKNDDWMDKVKPACENTLTFIQLVQRETFKAINRNNWCFEEYQLFVGAMHQKLKGHMEYEDIFKLGFSPVHTGEKKNQLMTAQQPFEYKPWIRRIFNDQHFTVLPIEPESFDETMYDLSCAIVNLTGRIIAHVPA